MNPHLVSCAAGMRAAFTGLAVTVIGGPGLGIGAAALVLAIAATDIKENILCPRPEFHTLSALSGLFASVAIAGAAIASTLNDPAPAPAPQSSLQQSGPR